MGRASHARTGNGTINVSKAVTARSGNIPGAAADTKIPASDPSQEAEFARGKEFPTPSVVEVARGMTTFTPGTVAGAARGGGQVALSPGQVGAWAQPRDTRKLSSGGQV